MITIKIVVYKDNHLDKVGVSTKEGVVPLPFSIDEVIGMPIEKIRKETIQRQNSAFNETSMRYSPCIPRDAKLICVGLNYKRHAEESGMSLPEYPVLFSKYNNALTGHGEEVPLPDVAEQYDYEAELGVVIGKQAKNISREQALEYVFGYCNVNDFSARDLQNRTSQWLTGKSLDGFFPVGPYLVTADEISDPHDLRIRCFVNGEKRQDSRTSDLIFKVDELISYISRYITLVPGDIISTGTPEGVILGYPKEKQEWLKPGDEVTVEIERLGRLMNTMKA